MRGIICRCLRRCWCWCRLWCRCWLWRRRWSRCWLWCRCWSRNWLRCWCWLWRRLRCWCWLWRWLRCRCWRWCRLWRRCWRWCWHWLWCRCYCCITVHIFTLTILIRLPCNSTFFSIARRYYLETARFSTFRSNGYCAFKVSFTSHIVMVIHLMCKII